MKVIATYLVHDNGWFTFLHKVIRKGVECYFIEDMDYSSGKMIGIREIGDEAAEKLISKYQ